MLKKLYQKDGIIMVFTKDQRIDECYFMINNNHEKNEKNEKKEYYIKKGFTYPQLNLHSPQITL